MLPLCLCANLRGEGVNTYNVYGFIKKEYDKTLRGLQQGSKANIAYEEDPVTGDPIISRPSTDLAAHKVSGDHDARYYTEDELNAGQLDDRYYTEDELNAGQLDDRYYTETEADARFAPITAAKVFHAWFSDTDTVVVNHNLGRRPVVQVVGGVGPEYGVGLYGAGPYGGAPDNAILVPDSIIHNTSNQLTIAFSTAQTGEVICVG